MDLKPLKTFHNTTNRLCRFSKDGTDFLVKCYSGPNAEGRRRREARVLSLWAAHGYFVPLCHDILIPGMEGPYLVMDYLDGICISEYLSSQHIPVKTKRVTLKKLFQNNAVRHAKALVSKNPDFVQYDANTGNIVITADRYFHVDFETPPKNRPIGDLVCKEMAKFCRWTVRDMGREYLYDITGLLVNAYEDQLWLIDRIVALPTRRPFQILHRQRDAKKKKRDPGEITKYDIADALKHLRQA